MGLRRAVLFASKDGGHTHTHTYTHTHTHTFSMRIYTRLIVIIIMHNIFFESIYTYMNTTGYWHHVKFDRYCSKILFSIPLVIFPSSAFRFRVYVLHEFSLVGVFCFAQKHHRRSTRQNIYVYCTWFILAFWTAHRV